MDSVCALATDILFLLSGRKYGVRTETARPRAGMHSFGWGAFPAGATSGLNWFNQYTRNEGAPNWLHLKAPVRTIHSVTVDGVTLDPADYLLYDNRKLVRVSAAPGFAPGWPLFQRLDVPHTERGTFSITYEWGQDVPVAARVAAQVFACQLAKYVNRDSDCALPDRLISVTRQGVTQTAMDPSQFIKEARTGLYLVDTWLGAVNPNGNRKRPAFVGPDDVTTARETF